MRLSLLFLFFLAAVCTAADAAVSVGAKVLLQEGLEPLRGKRVGVVTNATAMVEGKHLVTHLREQGVAVTALFGPEHGITGTAEDGVKVPDGTEHGCRTWSLYGATKKPTPAMLRDVDILLFDIQDIGVRFYTYISTLGLAMQAAAENNLPFVVLDRPNPLGGTYVSGFVLEPTHASFVGMYPIPVAHGMTAGELALMIRGERMLPGLEKLDLRVVKAEGWQREMRWPDTGLPWVPTSPNIRDFDSALLYPGTCFFEATAASEGRGTMEPFRLIGSAGLDAAAAVAELKRAALPGVEFEATQYTPRSIPGMSSDCKFRGKTIPGIRITVTEPAQVLPVETGIHLLTAVATHVDRQTREKLFRRSGFIALSGTSRLLEMIGVRSSGEIVASWQDETARFRQLRQPYLLYR